MVDNVIKLEALNLISSLNSVMYAFGDMVRPTTPDTQLLELPDDWFPSETSIGLDTTSNGVKLWYPDKATATDSVQLKSQQYPQPRDELNQIIHELGSGKLSILSSTHSNKILPVNVRGITTEKRMRLYKFLRNIVVGAKNTFEFEDEGNGLYLVRYVGKIIGMPMEFWLIHTAIIELRKEV